jgi:hypothetical protein
MKTFHEFLETQIIGGGVLDALKKRGKQFVKDASQEVVTAAGVAAATGGVATVPAAVGAATTVAGAGVKAATGALTDMGRKWRENAAVKEAMNLARNTFSAKGQRRDPAAVEQAIESYVDVPEGLLVHLSQEERDRIGKSLMDSVKRGSVQDWHSKKMAVEMLQKRVADINSALSRDGSMPKFRLRGVV